jgi:hypothetical protein
MCKPAPVAKDSKTMVWGLYKAHAIKGPTLKPSTLISARDKQLKPNNPNPLKESEGPLTVDMREVDSREESPTKSYSRVIGGSIVWSCGRGFESRTFSLGGLSKLRTYRKHFRAPSKLLDLTMQAGREWSVRGAVQGDVKTLF